jgi:hypothetical protein
MVEGYRMMEFDSGATALPGRFTEGFLHLPVRIQNLQFFARAPTQRDERRAKNFIPNPPPKTQPSSNHADIFNCLWGGHL